ncbi:hypothetical protein OQZ33_06960 [Pedobacter sp. MC2016-05]|uniref:hypothetical protein n=1 Tax=Pedobacter sp. MC2016-05 TaxID=2994474 RepID=UPI002246C881|nr:hypothetical protein [Pedobacter sp. MC2016-05]MCX2474064.1 hypothetical protein [Pedobacter sp. MC2016-05]
MTITLNTPTNFDLALCGTFNHTKQIHKIIWLIHETNYQTIHKGKLTMHKETYFKFLGLSGADLNKMLALLINQNIITQTTIGNNVKQTLSQFIINNPFKAEDARKHLYDTDDTKCPLFIKRWAFDNCRVKVDSSFVKPEVQPRIKKYVTVGGNVDEKDLLIQKLQQEIEELKAKLKATILPNVEPPVQLSSTKDVTISLTKIIARNGIELSTDLTLDADTIDLIKKKYSKALPHIFINGKIYEVNDGVLSLYMAKTA